MGRVFLFGGLMGIKRQRRETAIAEGKKPLTTRGSGGAPETEAILNISSENGVQFWILLISHLYTIKSKNIVSERAFY